MCTWNLGLGCCRRRSLLLVQETGRTVVTETIRIENGQRITTTTVTQGRKEVDKVEENDRDFKEKFEANFDQNLLKLREADRNANDMGCICSKRIHEGGIDVQSFRKKALDDMNNYRKMHGVPFLKLDSKLNKYAQEWSDHLAKTNTFGHRKERKYGENLAMTSGDGYKDAVKMWYEEVKNYNFRRPGFMSNTGHFSQVVWKSSKLVGIGVTRNPRGVTVVVANFDPPGNFVGHFEENVLPKKGSH